MSPSTGWVGRGVGVLGDFPLFWTFFFCTKKGMQQNGNEVFGCDVYVIYLIIYIYIWVFPKIGVPQNGWFIMENPIKMYDFGGKPTIFGNIHIYLYIHTLEVQVGHSSNISFSPKSTILGTICFNSRLDFQGIYIYT